MSKTLNVLLLPLLLTAALPAAASAGISILAELMKAPEAIVTVTSENASINASLKPKIAGKTASGRAVLARSILPATFTRKGTGILVSAGGLVAVNVHTVQQAARIKVTLANGAVFTATPLRSDPAHDVALLQIQGSGSLPFLRLADSSQVKLNSRVFSVGGSPLLKNTISEGKLRGIGQKKNSFGSAAQAPQVFQVSFDLYQGDSGSPVFDEHGDVLGIISAGAQHRNKTTFAIPSFYIQELLRSR